MNEMRGFSVGCLPSGKWCMSKTHTHTHTCIVELSRSHRNTQLLSFRWADDKRNYVFKHKCCVHLVCVTLCAPSVGNCYFYICVQQK